MNHCSLPVILLVRALVLYYSCWKILTLWKNSRWGGVKSPLDGPGYISSCKNYQPKLHYRHVCSLPHFYVNRNTCYTRFLISHSNLLYRLVWSFTSRNFTDKSKDWNKNLFTNKYCTNIQLIFYTCLFFTSEC